QGGSFALESVAGLVWNTHIEKLRELVDAVIYAPTKKDAKDPIRRLEFMASHIKGDIDGCLSGKLSEVVSYAKEASGQVRNKEHWISNVKQSWYVFENGVKDDQ
ncbi:MAG: hypothetical protein ACC700_16570, partial [Anaerolineales bacterium]